MTKGYLALVLHAHLPYVRHPEHEDHLEERWLFEAMTETYIPLLRIFDGFLKDGVGFKVTMSLTPPLANMLGDEFLQHRYLRHLDSLIELSGREIDRTTRETPEFKPLAEMYREIFISTRQFYWDRYGGNLLQAFRDIQATDNLEIITCAATHGFLPLMQHQPAAIRGQIETAAIDYERVFGRDPKGIWLPECGYFEGLDDYLAEAGLRYFLVDSHGINFAEPRPMAGVYAPIFCPSGVAAFARDVESSKQVWSSEEGYPGDVDYREFYRDVGFDLPLEYVGKYIHRDGIRVNTGMKYFRITQKSDLHRREIYNRRNALEKAAQHAANFMFNREKQVEWIEGGIGRKPIIVAPYDAELFGHWWFEGPDWINYLVRKVAYDQGVFELTTPRHYLEQYPEQQVAVPAASSWGDKGYYEVWLNGSNDWIYPHLHKAADRMMELADLPSRKDPLVERAVKQAMRELLLAQSSDWAFIMTTKTAVEYAVQRTYAHLERFNTLYSQIKAGAIDVAFLSDVEAKDNIFPVIDPDVFSAG
ncbi:MAG: DUF1957 domain-containing protein [Myxococcales bacterium]|nr:MAG: DUF1957 domain-containing protein [Myxococcales bacterium]